QPVLQLEDANGNPVSQSGVVVTTTVSPAGATPKIGRATSRGSGVASFTGLSLTGTVGSYTLSFGATGLTPATAGITLSAGTAGTNTLTAASSGLTGSPVTFTADGTAGAAGRVAFTTAPSSTAQSGVALAQQPVLQLEDANGNPVSQSGVVVTATVSPAGATPSNATATTNGSGVASYSARLHTGQVASYTLSFGATGLTPATAAITLSARSAAQM